MSCIQLNSVDYRHVSRTHCTVECVNGQLVLTDVSSSTGTYVNNRMFSRNAPGSVSLEEGDVIGIGCPTMGEDSYYQIQTHALLFRVCRKRERIPTVKTEDNVIEISDDESVGESFKPSSAAPTTLEQEVEECEQPDEPSLPPLLHTKDETGSRSPIKAELPYQSDTEMNGVPLPPLQKKPDTPTSENSDDSVVIVLDDEYTDQHYSQMVLENIKTESVDVPDEGQDANDCDDVLRTSGEWFSKLNNTVEWPFGRPDRQTILCDPKPMRKRRCSVIDNAIEPSGTTAGVSRQPFPSESPCKPVPKRRFSVVEAEKIVKQKMKRRASVSDRSMGSKKKEYQRQIAKKLQEVAAKESAQKSLEARQLIGAQQKTGVTLPRVKSTPNRGDFLMDPIATCSKKAPAKDTVSRPSYEDGIVCTQSTTLEELPCLDEVVENRSDSWIPGRYTCQMKVFSDQLAMEVDHDNSITFRPITTISPHIRQVLGLCMLQHSRILPIILDPEQNREQVVVPGNGFKKHIKVRKEILARIPPNALNEGQMNVMLSVLEECCLGESPSVSLIQGPPGTGKSRVISQLALEIWRFRRPGMKVMICAQSNTAVDVIALKLFNLRNDLAEGHRFNLVRIGTWDKIDPSCRSIFLEQLAYQKMQDKRLLPNDGHIKLEELQRRLGSLKCDARREFESTKRDIIEKADIVCSTLGSCHAVGTLCEAIIFDVCIIDEATQCTEPCSLVPLQYDMTKLVLVGDIKQLRATVLANKSMQAGLCDSLFSRMYNWFHKANLSAGIKTLNVQYRMHPEICSWPNNFFYEGRLISHSTAAAGGKLPLLPYVVLSLGYDQELTQIQHQIYNRDELVFVVKLLKQVLKYCRKDTSVAIITPYQRHKSEMVYELKRNQLQQIAVHSIDSVQGKEFDVVFVSLARSIGTGFLNSGERINVALTRARHSLILCGNFGSLVTTPVWSALLKDAEERKVLHELEGSCADTDVNSIVKKLRILPNI
ncbi:uncharacterized protein LOC131215697 [Anopheles bellator]|uniref:uncharacterized protein LOC131215697 n=1 Tax=Anopheles bellator TaxID=139047 RepID=UPI00264A3CF8|nr:uncharacterized protein LOC131215697 [Anopheles bellator]